MLNVAPHYRGSPFGSQPSVQTLQSSILISSLVLADRMWTSNSGSSVSIASMNPGNAASSRSCLRSIVPSLLMTNRRSTLPRQPAGWTGKSGMPMSQTVPPVLEPAAVEAAVEVLISVVLAAGVSPVDDDAPVVLSDSGALVTPGRLMPPKLDVSWP